MGGQRNLLLYVFSCRHAHLINADIITIGPKLWVQSQVMVYSCMPVS